MSLYIDHDPLKIKRVPNFCRLFKKIDDPDDVKVFKEENNQGFNFFVIFYNIYLYFYLGTEIAMY
jgi:hypothetical protein